MKFSDRVLKQYLKHVYWICGGPCGGKSTATDLLAARWGMTRYSSDDHTFDYQKKANPQDHPAILRHFVDWEWYFLGRGNDRGQWLNNCFEESVEFIMLDLLQLGSNKPIVVDTFMEPEFLKTIAEPDHMIYLFAEEELIRQGYFRREHVKGMEDLFPTLSAPDKAREDTLDMVARASRHYLEQARKHGVTHFIRQADSTTEDTLARIERHFQLQ